MTVLSTTGQRWILQQPAKDAAETLRRSLDIDPIVARCLALRVSEPTHAEAWLHPSIDHLHDPMAMHGMERAVERVKRATADQERIRIVTDYDVDGTTSSLILQGTLRLLGAGGQVDYHIPDRMGEGYGFSVAAAERAAADGVGLIITADIGVRDHEAVARAAKAGVDVIICDHHLPADADVPESAHTVLCPPQVACDYPNPALAACGVSLKLAHALLADHPRWDAILPSLLKVAAIGTVADVVDLSTPENRAIVAIGLDGLRNGPHVPGLQALLDAAGVDQGITARDIGFRIGPRINAAGRLAQATAVIELFDERNPHRARDRAQAIDRLNEDRQAIQRQLVDTCMGQLSDPPPAFAMLWGEEDAGWHRGVVGIVAAKVRDQIHRPVAIVSVSGNEARGSVRSTEAVHAVQALDSASDLLISHGGHPAAAGFSVATHNLGALAERLDAHARESTSAEAWVPELLIDAALDPSQLNETQASDLATALEALAPHGKGNPEPLLQIDGVRPTDVRPMGERHLRMRVGEIEAVWWRGREFEDRLREPVDLVCSLGFNHWRGRTSVRLTVEDVRASTGTPEPARDR